MGFRSKLVKTIFNLIPEAIISKSDGSISYGKNNLLPNELLNAISSSGTATSCVKKLKTFIEADGFTDKSLSKLKVNPEQTADQLLSELAYSQATFKGIALNVKYRLDGSVGSVYCMQFDKVRRTDYGDFIFNKTLGTKTYKKADDIIYIAFGSESLTEEERRNKIMFEIDKYGEQRGEVLYLYEKSVYSEFYPVPEYYAGVDDIISDGALTKLENRNITRGFRPTVIISTVGEIDDYNKDENGKTEADYFDENLKEFTGDDASTILHLEASTKEGLPSVNLFPLSEQLDGVDKATDRVARKVCRHIGVPPVLIGLTTPEGLGNTQAIANSLKLFNHSILPDQNLISSAFSILFPFRDWTISTLNLIDYIPSEIIGVLSIDEKRAIAGYPPVVTEGGESSSDVTLAEKLGVGGTQSLTAILTNIELTPQQKVQTLQILFGLNEENSQKLVYGSTQNLI